jgi:hypothetical protein
MPIPEHAQAFAAGVLAAALSNELAVLEVTEVATSKVRYMLVAIDRDVEEGEQAFVPLAMMFDAECNPYADFNPVTYATKEEAAP